MHTRGHLVLHGPNLNLLGEREPDIYGSTTLGDINRSLEQLALERGHHLLSMQSNAEYELVERVQDAKQEGVGAIYRPGREAAVLRRLAARHDGSLPLAVIVRLWRELMSAFVGLQGRFAVALWVDAEGGCRDLARDHFGSVVPLSVHATPRGVIRAVFDGEATVGVLPLPRDDDDEDPWWLALAGGGDSGVRICARLPVVAGGNSHNAADGAMVIADIDPDPSGADRSYVAIHYAEAMSRTRLGAALEAAGLAGGAIAQWTEPDGGGEHTLVEIDDFVTQSDARLARLVEDADEIDVARVVGVCALPLADPEKADP